MAATRRISVRLAGKEYPMTIPQAEEEKYRRAARDINSLIAAYKTRFMAEPEDYLPWRPYRWRQTRSISK